MCVVIVLIIVFILCVVCVLLIICVLGICVLIVVGPLSIVGGRVNVGDVGDRCVLLIIGHVCACECQYLRNSFDGKADLVTHACLYCACGAGFGGA